MKNLTSAQFFSWNVIANVCMALSINTSATIFAGGDTLSGWVRGCCCAFTINTVAAIIIPVGKIGSSFSNACHANKNWLLDMIARNFIVNAIYVTIVSFCMALINVGISENLVAIWLSTYFKLHLVGLITSIIIEKPVTALVKKLY